MSDDTKDLKDNKDKITWHITPQSIKTDIRMKALARAIKLHSPEDHAVYVDRFAFLLSCTTGLDFDMTRARPALRAFKQFVERDAATASGEALWDCCAELPSDLWNAWVEAVNEGQHLFDTDPAELPLSALTDAQRAEAATPGSPLT